MIKEFLLIPIVIYASFYIQNQNNSNIFISYYQSNLVFVPYLGVLFMIEILTICVHLILDTIFNYNFHYNIGSAKSRGCSVIILKKFLATVLLCFLFVFVSNDYFLFFTIGIASYTLVEFLKYLPYHSLIDNLVESSF